MGRELRRKQAKKEGHSLQQEQVEEQHQIKKLIKIICFLLFIVAIIYLISALFITKEVNWFTKKEETINTTVTNSILASTIFKQKEETYYVYFYDFKDEDNKITSHINSKLSGSKIYKVDSGSALNKKYISEASNKNAKTLEELKIVTPTLIKISNEKITEYYENDEIINNLK